MNDIIATFSNAIIIIERYMFYIICVIVTFMSSYIRNLDEYFKTTDFLSTKGNAWYFIDVPIADTLQILVLITTLSGAIFKVLADKKYRRLKNIKKRESDRVQIDTSVSDLDEE